MKECLLALPALFVLTGASLAHHGWGSYDAAKKFTIEAPVDSVRWENPHVHLMLQHDGAMWMIVLAPISRMQNRGLAPDILASGSQVAVEGYPSTRTANEMRAERITVGGKTFELR
jgi:hypothetical protein